MPFSKFRFRTFQGVPSAIAARGGALLAWVLGVWPGQAGLWKWSAGSANKFQQLDHSLF